MRKREWPPRPYTTRGEERVKVWSGAKRVDVALGRAGSAEARAAYARLLAEVEAAGGRLLPRSGATVAEVAAAWLAAEEGRLSHSEKVKMRRALGTAGTLYGLIPAGEFRASSLRACMSTWASEGASRGYVNELARGLRRVWKWAASFDLVPAAVVQQLGTVPGLRRGRGVAPDYEPVRPCERGEVERTLPHMPAWLADLVRLLYLTGARPGEIAALCPGDVDRAWKRIGRRRVWLYQPGRHKGSWRGGLRWIPLVPAAQEVLGPYLDRPEAELCFPGRAGPHTPNALAARVRRACRAAGTDWHLHQIRHAVGTEIQTRLSQEDARCVLGHATASMTARYAEWVERGARALLRL